MALYPQIQKGIPGPGIRTLPRIQKGLPFPPGGLRTIPRTPRIHKGLPFPPGGLRVIPRTNNRIPHPGQPQVTNSATTQTQAPDPRDSTYYANVNANQFSVNNKINGLNTQSGYANTDLQNALAKLAYQEPRDQLKAEQAANSRGGLYSSAYNQQLGDLTHAYQTNQGNVQNQFQRGQAARDSEIASLLGGVPLYNAQQYGQAAIRGSNTAAKNPFLGESTAPLTKAPGPAHPASHPAHPTHPAHPGHPAGRGRLIVSRAGYPAPRPASRPVLHVPPGGGSRPTKVGRITKGISPNGY